jgi:hypothetical protein
MGVMCHGMVIFLNCVELPFELLAALGFVGHDSVQYFFLDASN